MIAIGNFAFPVRTALADIRLETLHDLPRKIVRIRALLEGFHAQADLDAALDSLHAAVADFDAGNASLALHAGRYHHGRRLALETFVDPRAHIAAVQLDLVTADRFERSATLHTASVAIAASGDGIDIQHAGNAPARPACRLVAADAIVAPALSDGTRTLACDATLEAGQTLAIDAECRTARIAGTGVLADCSGDFPILAAGGTHISYTGDGPGHSATLEVDYRDTWF